jgi:hypothetical protein
MAKAWYNTDVCQYCHGTHVYVEEGTHGRNVHCPDCRSGEGPRIAGQSTVCTTCHGRRVVEEQVPYRHVHNPCPYCS